MQEQLKSIDAKITKLQDLLSAFMVKQESRVTRLETIQRALLWICSLAGTVIGGYAVTLFAGQ